MDINVEMSYIDEEKFNVKNNYGNNILEKSFIANLIYNDFKLCEMDQET